LKLTFPAAGGEWTAVLRCEDHVPEAGGSLGVLENFFQVVSRQEEVPLSWMIVIVLHD
jgi:hypothetical protein